MIESIFFSEKKKKASKWFYKMKKRYLDLGTTDMHIVDAEKFKFKKPEWKWSVKREKPPPDLPEGRRGSLGVKS